MIDLPVIPIERLTRRLAECPQEFLAEPWSGPKDGDGLVRVAAVVSDLLTDLGLNDRLNPSEIKTWRPGERTERNRLRLPVSRMASSFLGPIPEMRRRHRSS